MFRKMRRFKQILPQEMTEEILKHGTEATLALQGTDGWPYAVPINYVYDDGKIYFHTSKSGLKIECMEAHPQVSLCVMDATDIVEEEYTTYFRSVIVFGRATIIKDEAEKREAIMKFCRKFVKCDTDEQRMARIEKEGVDGMYMVRIDIAHMSGKEAIELVRKREGK